ncbi:MAG: ABC transporter ATP-binding protein [Lysobacteraceae bacterium]|nr:MAG: ABC transporter ATP-binding protein [Xanthomonadaceae bacterium]
MTLVRLKDVSLEFGDTPLLSGANFELSAGEKVCLIGRNGAGKSSLFRLITGVHQPDEGEVEIAPLVSVAQLDQELETADTRQVRAVVESGLQDRIERIKRFEQLSSAPSPDAAELDRLQRTIDATGGWDIDTQVQRTLDKLGLPGERCMSELSGGWRRRVSLARALVSEPDVLLLDEPTNHLDINSIEWLENEVRGWAGAVLFITHDRSFMQRLATRIVELDLGQLTSWEGSYQQFLQAKEKALEDEATQHKLFDKRLAAEETWIRQGIKARRTRNEGRVRALQAMRLERSKRLSRQGKANLKISEAEQSGRKVITAKGVHYAYQQQDIISGLSLKVMRGDRLGVVGNNGVGKTTLLRLLLGELAPQQGTIKLGTKLEIAWFDQLRSTLDTERTVIENVGEGREFVTINGKQRHVISYLGDFLFSPGRAQVPVKALSGGERNRVILARLFARPANLLVLDEPTNDLDVEMLEVLEARLVEYEGTLIIVSHDRQFLDNVVTSVLVFEQDGGLREYVGGYSDWQKTDARLAVADHAGKRQQAVKSASKPAPKQPQAKKKSSLSYVQKKRLEKLPEEIERIEKSIGELEQTIGEPSFYQQDKSLVAETLSQMTALQTKLEQAMDEWATLEDLA